MLDLILSMMAMEFVKVCKKMRVDLALMTSSTILSVLKSATDEEKIKKSKELYQDAIKNIFQDIPDDVFIDTYNKAKSDLDKMKNNKETQSNDNMGDMIKELFKGGVI